MLIQWRLLTLSWFTVKSKANNAAINRPFRFHDWTCQFHHLIALIRDSMHEFAIWLEHFEHLVEFYCTETREKLVLLHLKSLCESIGLKRSTLFLWTCPHLHPFLFCQRRCSVSPLFIHSARYKFCIFIVSHSWIRVHQITVAHSG